MENASFTQAMAIEILSDSVSSTRFEQFCIELFSEYEGIDYVPTSVSWDLGRDGRTMKLGRDDDMPFIACSLRSDVPAKVMEDIERLLQTGPVKRLRFCSSQELTEHAREAIKQSLKSKCPSLEDLAIDGTLQITALLLRDDRYVRLFERFYTTELESIRTALDTPIEGGESVRITGMRIALTTQLSRSGDALRADVIRNLILTALSDRKPKTTMAISKHVSEQLHLGRNVDEHYIEPSIQQLLEEYLIVPQDGGYLITQEGVALFVKWTSKGAKNLLEGQKMVRDAIKGLTGRELSDPDFGSVWKVLQDELADLFYQNGMQIIEAIASITEGEAEIRDFNTLADSINRLGKKIERVLLGGAIAQEIGQAIIDMFHDKALPTFEWFTDLCACYVTICSLGLDPAAQQAILARLRNIDLILDTDIVLSYLSEGENDHEAIETIVKGWRRIGGQIYVTLPVLEEVSHHAAISQNDFNEAFHQMHTYSEEDARRLLTNAFTRGFWAVVKRKNQRFSAKGWREYINNFLGQSAADYERVTEVLKESNIRVLTNTGIDYSLAREIAKQIQDARRRNGSDKVLTKEMLDKNERDSYLLALLIKHRAERKEAGGLAVIVSSSFWLGAICRNRKEFNGQVEAVMPLGAIAYLLAMAPGVQMSIQSLKGVLFNPGLAERLTPLQRTALRVIHDSTEYSMPFSRRPALQREMYSRMSEIAADRGQPVEELLEQAEHKSREQEDLLKDVIYKAIDAVAYSESEKKIQSLITEIDKLKEENKKLRKGK
jgi:hypothetical protein